MTADHRSLPLVRRRFETTHFFDRNKSKIPAIVSAVPGLFLQNYRLAFHHELTVSACLSSICRKIPEVRADDVILEAVAYLADGTTQRRQIHPAATMSEVYDTFKMEDDNTLYLELGWKVENEPFEWEIIEPES